jgi:hypothetical protein
MGFGVGFRSPFESHANADDRRIADHATTPQQVNKIETMAGQEHALGRGSMGDAVGANKSIGDTLGAKMGGISSVSGSGNVAGAYDDSGVHAGKDPVSG